jgi:hypothetical protein
LCWLVRTTAEDKTGALWASRSPAGRGRRQPHTRPLWARRCRRSTHVTGAHDQAGRGQPGPHGSPCSEHDVEVVRAPSGVIGRRRCQPTRVCGWRRPRPPGLRLAAGAGGAVVADGNDAPKADDCAAGAARALPGCGWPTARPSCLRRSFLPANTSYMRPAPWPPTMHKCARAPALPRGPHRRHVCTIVQRRDPTLPRAPHRRPLCTRVQRRARTQFDTHVNERPPWSVWPG